MIDFSLKNVFFYKKQNILFTFKIFNMDELDVKTVRSEMSERNVDTIHLPGIMQYLLPQKKVILFLRHSNEMKPDILKYSYEDFIEKYRVLRFSMISTDRLKLYLHFEDDEKVIQHCFVIPTRRNKREIWIRTFKSHIVKFPTGSEEMEPFFFKIGWDETLGCHSFMITKSMVQEDYELFISYKLTPLWLNFFQKMVEVLELIDSYEP